MMMTLGLFVFELNTASYQSLARQSTWQWEEKKRIGLRAMQQYLGKGQDTIALNGVLMPEITGGKSNLEILKRMADQGKANALIDGAGKIYGLFIITHMNNTQGEFFQNGQARKIEFNITLKRIDDDAVDQLDNLSGYVQSLVVS